MRKWIKYSLDREHVGTRRVDHDRSFDDHKLAMGGYHPDESYVSREEFFRKYFYGFQVGRLEFSNDFLRRSLSKHERVLSIGSGRCASELHLMEDGYGFMLAGIGPILVDDLSPVDAVAQQVIQRPPVDGLATGDAAVAQHPALASNALGYKPLT